jgi:hypothetical protein
MVSPVYYYYLFTSAQQLKPVLMWSIQLHNSILKIKHTTTELSGMTRVIGTTHETIHTTAAAPKQRSVPASDISEHWALQQVV